MPVPPWTRRVERGVLSAGLALVAMVADWLLARRLAHDGAQHQPKPRDT